MAGINQVLPVVLDRGNPARVEIVWDQVQSRQDRVQMRTARRLDDARQAVASGSASDAPAGDGSPQDLMRQALANPAVFAEKMRAQGMTSAGLPRGAQAAAAPAASAPVDLADRVAKLADLRDRGALTEDEFQAQKKRILGG